MLYRQLKIKFDQGISDKSSHGNNVGILKSNFLNNGYLLLCI